jgi:nucleoid-associated protein YgaU
MIHKGSRYVGTPVITGQDPPDPEPRALARRTIPPTPGVARHTVSDGERLDHLADRYYGNPQRYWLLLDANADELNPFHLLVPGRRIELPRNRVIE